MNVLHTDKKWVSVMCMLAWQVHKLHLSELSDTMSKPLDGLHCYISSIYPEHDIYLVETLRLLLRFLYRGGVAVIPDTSVLSVALISLFPTYQETLLHKFCCILCYSTVDQSFPPRPRCSELGCQLVASREADGTFGRWDLTERTWFAGDIPRKRCQEASLFLCLFAWWTPGTPHFCHTYHGDVLPQCGLKRSEELTSDQTLQTVSWHKPFLSAFDFLWLFHHSAREPTKKHLPKLSFYGL